MPKDDIDFLCSTLWYGYYCDRGIATREDKIDFPCSDPWYDYYYDRGLTTRQSANRRECCQTKKIEGQNYTMWQINNYKKKAIN